MLVVLAVLGIFLAIGAGRMNRPQEHRSLEQTTGMIRMAANKATATETSLLLNHSGSTLQITNASGTPLWQDASGNVVAPEFRTQLETTSLPTGDLIRFNPDGTVDMLQGLSGLSFTVSGKTRTITVSSSGGVIVQ